MAYENKLCWRWKHSNMNVGHDCCVLLFSADSPLRITVPELTHFTKLPCKLLWPPFILCVKTHSISTITVPPLFAHKAHSQGDSYYTKQCLTLTRYSGHVVFCRRQIGKITLVWVSCHLTVERGLWEKCQYSIKKFRNEKQRKHWTLPVSFPMFVILI